MSERIALVTGGSSGIGRATAEILAKEGLRVALLCRDLAGGELVRKQLFETTRNDRIDVFAADLASQSEIHRVADEILCALPRLDILINNAGAIFSTRQLSPDGIEMTLATNYLSGYLLTQLLRPALEESGFAHVVNLSSALHRIGRIRFDDPNFERGYYIVWAYAQSKFAIVASTLSWARRLQSAGVAVNCIDPGLVRSNIGLGASSRPDRWAWHGAAVFGRRPVAAGAFVSRLALRREPGSGGYFARERIVSPQGRSLNRSLQDRLNELSEDLVAADRKDKTNLAG